MSSREAFRFGVACLCFNFGALLWLTLDRIFS